MQGIKVPNKSKVQNKGARDPRTLLWPVPLPVHQKLHAPTPPPDVQKAAHRESRVAIHNLGGWRGLGRRAESTGGDRLQEGDME